MQVTINDYHRLVGMIELHRSNKTHARIIEQLWKNLKTAKRITQVAIPRTIVTMNSKVRITDIVNGRQAVISITYPHQANPLQGKISVLSPTGIALLGAMEGDAVSWEVPDGKGHFLIEQILYQPEAAGHYHL